MRLEDKVALITGAGSGIGRETTLLFTREGASVVVVDVNDAAGQETVSMVQAQGGQASYVHADISQAADCEKMVRAAEEGYGKLNVLFNNAGISHINDDNAETTEEAVWDLTMNINLKGVFLGCKYGIPALRRAGGGSIINTASMLGLVASPRQAPYCAAKGGVVLLTKQIAIDYARDNIRVNCICPSEVDTPMHRQFIAASPDPEATKKRLLERIPLNRVARPEEIAAAALFLASDDSSYVTGVALPVDGGLTAL
jgi:NAD(P)-dependent dehydrogenase (short-subunit alcohol dehydrogenase family)